MRYFIFLLFLLFLLAGTLDAAERKIYRTTDENGNPVFSDMPPKGDAKSEAEITVTPANVYQSGSVRPVYEPGLPVISGADGYYQVLDITSPNDEVSLRDNAGNVHIAGILRPDLRTGHKIRLVLDGTMTELEANGLQFNLANVDRGSHQIQLVVVDPQGNQLVSSSTTRFHLQRARQTPVPVPPSITPSQ